MANPDCRCGHTLELHTHLHDHTYCSIVACDCPAYARRRWWLPW